MQHDPAVTNSQGEAVSNINPRAWLDGAKRQHDHDHPSCSECTYTVMAAALTAVLDRIDEADKNDGTITAYRLGSVIKEAMTVGR